MRRMMIEKVPIIGAVMFGETWRRRMCHAVPPIARALSKQYQADRAAFCSDRRAPSMARALMPPLPRPAPPPRSRGSSRSRTGDEAVKRTAYIHANTRRI